MKDNLANIPELNLDKTEHFYVVGTKNRDGIVAGNYKADLKKGTVTGNALINTISGMSEEDKAALREALGVGGDTPAGDDPRLYKGGLLLDLSGAPDNPNIELRDGFTVDDIEGFPSSYGIFKLKDSLLPFFNGQQCDCPEIVFDAAPYYGPEPEAAIIPCKVIMPLVDFYYNSEGYWYKYWDRHENSSLTISSDGTLDTNYEGD